MSDLSPAAQQYIRAIYDLQESHMAESVTVPSALRVTTSQLAESMGLRAASITAMLQKLDAADPPLIEYTKHQGALLTADGRRAALALVRRHRLLEAYLYERLNFRWDEIHAEAQRLEPVVSEALAERMAEALGQPARDPHGHAIPGPDLALETADLVPLIALHMGEQAIVVQVSDTDPELLRILAAGGLLPDAALTVVGRRDGAHTIELKPEGTDHTIVLPAHHASNVFVMLTNNGGGDSPMLSSPPN